MDSVIAKYDGESSFWEVNPQFKILNKFSDFYRKDRTKGKIRSSEIMWALAFLLELTPDNKLRNYNEHDRKKLIAEEIIQNPDFKWEDHKELHDEYLKTQFTTTKKSLRILKKKMEERDEFLSSIKYNVENARDLDAIIANSDKLFSLISKLEAEVEKEDNKDGGQTKGGRKESASELKQL
jgi:hypothetical protein